MREIFGRLQRRKYVNNWNVGGNVVANDGSLTYAG
jgi:hypothetical protein